VLAAVRDRLFGSGSELEPNCSQIGGLGHQETQTPNSGTVRWTAPNPCELGGLPADCPAGPSVHAYQAHAFAGQ
jgi:hypothetical protein